MYIFLIEIRSSCTFIIILKLETLKLRVDHFYVLFLKFSLLYKKVCHQVENNNQVVNGTIINQVPMYQVVQTTNNSKMGKQRALHGIKRWKRL